MLIRKAIVWLLVGWGAGVAEDMAGCSVRFCEKWDEEIGMSGRWC